MANRTDPLAKSVHGTNPQNLVEHILRAKIYQSQYWKEHCFGLTAETIVDKAVELRYVGGTYGGARKPTEFICLILKMLQIQPDKEIIIEFIRNEEYKYLRLLGAYYLRLTGKPLEVYQYLEPLYNDYRKVRQRNAEGVFELSHMDEVVDNMLQTDYMFDIALPFLPSRLTLEKTAVLEPRVSVLDEEFDELALEAEAGQVAAQAAALEEAATRAAEPARRSPERTERRRERERPREEEHAPRARERDHGAEREPGERDHRDRGERRGRDRDWEEPPREHGRERERGEYERSTRGDPRSERGDYDRDRRRERDDPVAAPAKRRRSPSPERRREKEDKGRGEKSKRREADNLDPEIAEANAQRAKLGLKPLR